MYQIVYQGLIFDPATALLFLATIFVPLTNFPNRNTFQQSNMGCDPTCYYRFVCSLDTYWDIASSYMNDVGFSLKELKLMSVLVVWLKCMFELFQTKIQALWSVESCYIHLNVICMLIVDIHQSVDQSMTMTSMLVVDPPK